MRPSGGSGTGCSAQGEPGPHCYVPHLPSVGLIDAEPFADFFDFVALGDGEELLVEIGQCLRRCRAAGLDRDSTLFSLATQVEGVYVPQFYDAPGG